MGLFGKGYFFHRCIAWCRLVLICNNRYIIDLCYDTFTAIAKFDVLDIPIVDQIIKTSMYYHRTY